MLKTLTQEDLPILWHLIYAEKNPEWKKYDAPYFPLKSLSLDMFCSKFKQKKSNQSLGIWLNKKLISVVSYYWEHQPSNWLEVGIDIYSPKYWCNGYGSEALLLWISHLFRSMPLVRVGLTTWSGNLKMMNLAQKLGMKQEACLRKCRFWQGQYYDSIRYGVLREEWFINNRYSDGK